MKTIGSVLGTLVIFLVIKFAFGIGRAVQDAAYEPVASDDPRLVMNGGDCDVILAFPKGTTTEERQTESTLFLVKHKNDFPGHRWDGLPNGDYCISPDQSLTSQSS